MFPPKWKKEADMLAKAARKFVHYKRDLLAADRIDEIESRRGDLLAAVKGGDKAKVAEASKLLRAKCDGALPRYTAPNWFEENVEVMFVAVVVAFGLRAYFLQPFRIPTGSMQPTLNGIIGQPLTSDKWPSLPQRVVEGLLRGRSYEKVINERERQIKFGRDAHGRPLPMIRDVQFLQFFSRSEIEFTDGSVLRMPAPVSQMREIGLDDALAKTGNRGVLPAGTVMGEGSIDAGDLVLVDKVSYHFRKPKRGEVFVFDTRGIEGTKQVGGEQAGGTHYIKRLCGLPGDVVQVDSPYLKVNGNIAQEPGIERVYTLPVSRPTLQNPEGTKGYTFAGKLSTPEGKLEPRANVEPNLREYIALGDNSANSSDSRYWGTVQEFNLSGPALFSLWPVTTGHWGFIK